MVAVVVGLVGLLALMWQSANQSSPPLPVSVAATKTTTAETNPAKGGSSKSGLGPTTLDGSQPKLGRHTDQLFESLSIFDSPALLEKKRVQTLEQDLADAIRQMCVFEDAVVKINERFRRDIPPKPRD